MAARRLLRGCWADAFLPALEKVFDESHDDQTIVHLPTLELYFKVESVERFVEDLSRLISEQVRGQLDGMRHASPRQNVPQWQPVSVEENDLQQLVEYLRTGRTAWPWPRDTPHALASAFRKTALKEAPQILARLTQAGPGVAWNRVFFRWFQLVGEDEWPALGANVVAANPRQIGTTIASIVRAPTQEISSHLRLFLVSALAAQCMMLKDAESVSRLAAWASRLLPTYRETAASGQSAAWHESLDSLSKPTEQTATTRDFLRLFLDLAPGGEQPEIKRAAHLLSQLEPSAGNTPADDTAQLQSGRTALEPAGAQLKAQFGVTVPDSGLVILHPFLPRLFETLGIRREGQSLPEAVLPRAGALLHFLATGEECDCEFELDFVKVLLGLTPDTPLLVSPGLLTAADKEEAERLLEAAIGYWAALKNTSPQALRTSFLQRVGLLHKEEDGWRLQVESQPFDMLLGQLPWAFSIVLLPWMSSPIFTEWASP